MWKVARMRCPLTHIANVYDVLSAIGTQEPFTGPFTLHFSINFRHVVSCKTNISWAAALMDRSTVILAQLYRRAFAAVENSFPRPMSQSAEAEKRDLLLNTTPCFRSWHKNFFVCGDFINPLSLSRVAAKADSVISNPIVLNFRFKLADTFDANFARALPTHSPLVVRLSRATVRCRVPLSSHQ